jgi:hypothetical protein
LFGLTYKGRVESVHSFVVTNLRWRQYWCPDCAATAVLGLCIIYRSMRDFEDVCVRQHELQHILHAREMGRLRAWLTYRYYQRTLGYAANPLEIDARRAADCTRQAMFDRLQQRGLLR